MLIVMAVAWIACALVCLADLLDRRAERRHRQAATRISVTRRDNVTPLRIAEPPSNVTPLRKAARHG